MEQATEVLRHVADGIAVLAEEPGDSGGHARRKASAAGLGSERLLLELGTDERVLLQRKGGAVLLLSDRRNSSDDRQLYNKTPSIKTQRFNSSQYQLPARTRTAIRSSLPSNTI